MIRSLLGDGTCSWVMIVNRLNKYVTDMTEETQDDDINCIGESTGTLVAKARPKQTSMPTSSSSTTTLPYHQSEWIDVEPGPFDKRCFELSKLMISLLRRYPTVLREEEDGAVEFRILAQMFHSEFWSNSSMAELLAKKGGGPRKRFLCCVDLFHAGTILYLPASQGHSGGNHIIARQRVTTGRVRRAHLPRRKLPRYALDVRKGRHAVFFTAVNPIFIDLYREKDYDVKQPRIAVYKNNWKIQ